MQTFSHALFFRSICKNGVSAISSYRTKMHSVYLLCSARPFVDLLRYILFFLAFYIVCNMHCYSQDFFRNFLSFFFADSRNHVRRNSITVHVSSMHIHRQMHVFQQLWLPLLFNGPNRIICRLSHTAPCECCLHTTMQMMAIASQITLRACIFCLSQSILRK